MPDTNDTILGAYAPIADIAARYNITTAAVQKAAQRGAVKTEKIANRWFIESTDAARMWGDKSK